MSWWERECWGWWKPGTAMTTGMGFRFRDMHPSGSGVGCLTTWPGSIGIGHGLFRCPMETRRQIAKVWSSLPATASFSDGSSTD